MQKIFMENYLRNSVFLLGMLALVGCGSGDDGLPRTVDASGVIMCDGAPLDGATILIVQDDGKFYARGMSDSQGRFSLDMYESKPGAVPGTYKATVSKTVTVDKATPSKTPKTLAEDAEHAAEGDPTQANASWVNDLPEKYNNPQTSGLTLTVPDDGSKNLSLEVSRN